MFILYKNELFASGLDKLLRIAGLEIVGIGTQDRETLDRIIGLDPDIIIAEVEKKKSEAELLLARLLKKRSRATVVRLSLADNSATLYSGHRWTANTAEDLMKGIVSSVSGTNSPHKHVHTGEDL